MKRIIASLACIAAPTVALTVAVACAGQHAAAKASSSSSPAAASSSSPTIAQDPAPEPVMERGTVRAIKLPEVKTELPPGPGRETVAGQCIVCHTLNYINIQPPFSKETWTAEVTKMQKTFSAPIPDDKIPEIVNYLVAVRGKPAK